MAYNSEHPYSNDITQVAEPVGTGPESPYRVIDLQNIMPSIIEKSQDYSADVAQLATSPDKIWSSTDPTKFTKNGKINFLHLNKDGIFTLTIIKPGTKTVLSVNIDKTFVDAVWGKIQSMTDWDKSKSPESWQMPGGDIDGNTYIFNRFLDLWFGLQIHWVGQHKNVGAKVIVNDTLTIQKWVNEAHDSEA